MDLSTLDTADLANQGAPMPVHGPDGAPLYQDDGETPVTITLLGEDSDVLTRFDKQVTNQHLRGMQTGQQTVTAEIAEAKHINRLARAVVSWSGIVVDGKPLECTEDNAKALFRRFRWLRSQATTFIADRAHFMKASPTS